MVPNTVVVGTGVELLYFSVVSTLLGMGVAPLISKLLRKPHQASEERRGRKGWWVPVSARRASGDRVPNLP